MRITVAALLAPLAAHAHPGHDAATGGLVHWATQHAPGIGIAALVLAASVAAWGLHRRRRRR